MSIEGIDLLMAESNIYERWTYTVEGKEYHCTVFEHPKTEGRWSCYSYRVMPGDEGLSYWGPLDPRDGTKEIVQAWVDVGLPMPGSKFPIRKNITLSSLNDLKKHLEHLDGDRECRAFVSQFQLLSSAAFANAQRKGFYQKDRGLPEEIALMHSELSEALEAYRAGVSVPDDKVQAFQGVEAELADCIIRIMDTAVARNLNVADALAAKMFYNAGRPHMHGGKRI